MFVLFGASGDLAGRKIFPALYDLYQSQIISKDIVVIGNSRTGRSDVDFRQLVFENLTKYYGQVDLPTWRHLEQRLFFVPGDANDPKTTDAIAEKIKLLKDQGWNTENRLYYLAIIPEVYEAVLTNLGKVVSVNPTSGWQRVMVEKPFGTDLASAKKLNRLIFHYFNENDVFRMDHFLAKETVQNILAFRFANGIFEPIWNKKFVDSIQVSSLETHGIDGREIFYDHTGAIRDVVQNHVLQILAVALMDMPASLEPQAVRQKSLELLQEIQKIPEKEIAQNVVYGQYGRGDINGEAKRAYIQEENISEDSKTETYVAMKLTLASERWSGVPVYIRAGKRLAQDVTEISIRFKDPVKNLPQFAKAMSPNILTIRVQPNEGIVLRFDAKKPGFGYDLQPVNMEFRYTSAFAGSPLIEAYERLINDAVNGDHILFPNAEGVETTWRIVTPLLQNPKKPHPVEIYSAGSMGPTGAEALLARDHRFWFDLSSGV